MYYVCMYVHKISNQRTCGELRKKIITEQNCTIQKVWSATELRGSTRSCKANSKVYQPVKLADKII
jgi:hypothetical protein